MLSESQSRKAAKLKADGATLEALAERFNTTVSNIRTTAKHYGWSTSRPPNGVSDEEVLAAFEKGYTWQQISKKFGITLGSARSASKRAGHLPLVEPRKFTDKEKALVKKLFDQDVTINDIADRLNRRYQTIHSLIKREGYWENKNLRFKSFFNEKQEAIAKKMNTEGASLGEIADKLNFTYQQTRFALYRTDWYVKRPVNLKPLTQEESDVARQMNKDGFLMKEIGAELGRTKQIMKKMAKTYGWYHEVHPNPSMKSGMYKLREVKLKKLGLDKIGYYSYRYLCRLIARNTYKEYADIIDPDNLRSRDYHVDHRYSVASGVRNWIDPAIVSHPANLRMLSGAENRRKSSKSSISLDKLMRLIEKFEKLHGKFNPNCEFYDAESWHRQNILDGLIIDSVRIEAFRDGAIV